MVPTGFDLGALVVLALGAGFLGYALGRFTGRRAERRRWERRIAGAARDLDHTRGIIRRALDKDERR
jgi:hypothetical protein